jgi:Na+/phosphate symporter
MVIWSSFFIEYWKRIQITAAMKWGVIGFEADEQVRPQYVGEDIKSYIDGSDIIVYPEYKKKKRQNIVYTIVLFCIILVVVVVAATFYLQYALTNPPYSESLVVDIPLMNSINAAYIIVPLINAIVIIVANLLYTKIVFRLNDFENHKTDTDYEDNLIAKIFVFQLINSFAALTYISFIKSFLGTCRYALVTC